MSDWFSHMRPARSLPALFWTAGLAFLSVACGDTAAKEEQACADAKRILEEETWPTVLGPNCAECHTPGGPAASDGSNFILLSPGYPNFQQQNLENLAQAAAYEVNDVSVLLLKPQGKLDHGGGTRLRRDSEEYAALESLVDTLAQAGSCNPEASVPEPEDVTELSEAGTLRKAALHLAYRLPSDEEVDALAEGTPLRELVEGLLEDEAFLDRLKDIFNDKFLAERYLAYTGYALQQLDDTMYPLSDEYWDELDDDDLRRRINRAVAHEPLDFVAYLVKNDKPFTDVVAGDYMVVNPLTAPFFNASVVFEDPSNEDEWVEVPRTGIVEVRDDVYLPVEIPSAGVLTSPMFLNRFPTTPTNRNRHRARMILDFFLGTDILKVGDRPLDPTVAGRYPNPTMNDPSCSSCHEILDPIAGAFQKYSDNNQERYEPTRSWYGELRAAGFGDVQMPTTAIPNAPSWLGERIARDPRFPFAMVKIVYEGLMGRTPVEYPEDYDAEDYQARFEAWQEQEALFQSIGRKFVESNYNLKTVFVELILSPYYRAAGLSSEPDEWRELTASELGTARLSTPMLLARKIEAVTGIPWRRGWDRSDYLLSDYRILYGGIDSDTVNHRLTQPNGVMAGVAWRMANEMACTVTAWEFYLPDDERVLLSGVTMEDTPETSSDAIKDVIAHLHRRILGESPTDADVARTYDLFLETWTEGQDLIADETNDVGNWMNYRCQARDDYRTGEEIPEDDRIRTDELYTARSWRAVLTYLLSDYQFLYE